MLSSGCPDLPDGMMSRQRLVGLLPRITALCRQGDVRASATRDQHGREFVPIAQDRAARWRDHREPESAPTHPQRPGLEVGFGHLELDGVGGGDGHGQGSSLFGAGASNGAALERLAAHHDHRN